MPTPIDRRISASHLCYRFDAALPPAWRVRPGEWIEAEVPDGMAGTIQRPDDLYRAVDPDHVNPVVGPIYVEGAEATDTLSVELREIRVDAPQGYVLIIPGFGLLRDRYPAAHTRICRVADGAVQFDEGVRLPLDPCIGTIGVAPAGPGISTIMPGDHGGNLDTTDIRQGATVYFPVSAPGALFGLGDPKGVMGDGEVAGTGLGVPITVVMRFALVKGWRTARPLLETRRSWMTIASAPTLEGACHLATADMVGLLVRARGITREAAYMLTSLAGDLRISQVVDPWMTVRMEMSKDVLSLTLPPP
ncbi:MAG TPA: acetamidase/formamidase family protein [bacterium]|nr:acetamidase/formamidase family protein [bacterium]